MAMEPGDVLVWTLEYENHSDQAFSLYVLTANPNMGALGSLLEPCIESEIWHDRMVAPFSVHIEPAGPQGVADPIRHRVESLPVVIDSRALPAPVSQIGYRVVIDADENVDVLPIRNELRQRREIC